MSDIGFYHLTRTGPDAALPGLLARTLKAQERAVVKCGSAERVVAVDAALWEDPEWLPHGTVALGHAELQPIWITHQDEAPNGGRYLFLLDGAECGKLENFSRIFDLFDGKDEAAIAAARLRWSARSKAGHALTYWQQGSKGWEKK